MGATKKINLTGKRFGLLVVVKRHRKDKRGNRVWSCLCDCGKTTYVSSTYLNRGRTKSCGCNSGGQKENLKEGTWLSLLQQKSRRNNTSGVIGVSFNRRKQKWVARITFKKNVLSLGSYTKKEDAIKARKEAEEKYFVPMLEKYGKIKKQKDEG